MFKFECLGQVALSVLGSVLLTSTVVGAAVGPARAIETTPVVGSAQLAVVAHA